MALEAGMMFMFIASTVGSIIGGGLNAAKQKCAYETQANQLQTTLNNQQQTLAQELADVKKIDQYTINKIIDIQEQTAFDVNSLNVAQQKFANSHKLLVIIVTISCCVVLLTLLIKLLF